MAIRTNTNPMRPDLQPEMRALLMRNGMQAHVVPVGDSYLLVVQGHDSPLLRYPISRQQMQALTDWGTNHANKKAYNTFTEIVKNDFELPRNFVHARNANGRGATVSASVSMAGSAGTVCRPLSSDGLPDSRKAITCAGSAAGFSMQVRLWWQNARTDE